MKKLKTGSVIIIMDLSKAYHRVIRKKLFEIIRVRKILGEDEIKFMEIIYENLYYLSQDKKIHLNNGVFMGISGAVFEFLIYLDEALKHFRNSLTNVDLEECEFADDIILAVDYKSVRYVLK